MTKESPLKESQAVTDFFQMNINSYQDFYITISKQLFLLLPMIAIGLALTISIPCLLSFVIRKNRMRLTSIFLVTWWDLFQSIISFWAGIMKFTFYLITSLFLLIKISAMFAWALLKDFALFPIRYEKQGQQNYFEIGIPWLAISLTIFTALIETLLLTMVTTAFFTALLIHASGVEFSLFITTPLMFLLLLFFTLSSYLLPCLLPKTIAKKDYSKITAIAFCQIVILSVEITFLYKTFTIAVLQSLDIIPSTTFALLLATTLWLGIRLTTWVLYAKTGSHYLSRLIDNDTSLQEYKVIVLNTTQQAKKQMLQTNELILLLKKEFELIKKRNQMLSDLFILPPMQIVGALLNFFSILIKGEHSLNIPIKNPKDLKKAFKPE